jgi:undecaprenyl-diphosphatase
MDYFQAIILGSIQGLTEFLPVSSSGHLVLCQNLFGLKEPELLFDISVHVGTLAAVCVIFFNDIRSILTTIFSLPRLLAQSGGFKRLYAENEDFRIAGLIIIGSIPTAILGVCFHAAAEQIFGAVWIVGCMLIVTGILLWMTRRIDIQGRKPSAVTAKDALIIGLIQGLAILPGISRSGSTISMALFLGVNREFAGRFSFLLSIPAIFGALLISIDSSVVRSSASAGTVLLGTAVAAAIGYLALKILLKLVNKGQIYRFAPYCWLVGIATLSWTLF